MLRRLLLASAIATAIGDNYWANYSSLLRFQAPNGTITFPDERGKVWTRNGNVVIQNNRAVFDGSGDYLRTPAHADFAFAKGDFTVEAYVYKTSYTGGGVANDETIFGSYGAGSIAFFLDNATGQPKTWGAITSSIAVPLNKLTHVVWCRSNGVFRIFVDGTLGYEKVYPFSITNITNPWSVGGNTYNDGTRYFNGELAGVRVSREALYTTEFTPPQAPFPTGRTVSLLHFDKDLQWDTYVKLMLHLNGTHGSTVFTDARFGTVVTRVGTPIISTNTAKFGGASLNISGDNHGASIPGTWSLTEDGTVEGWAYLDSGVSGRTLQAIFGNIAFSGAVINTWTVFAQLVGAEWKLSAHVYDNAGTIQVIPAAETVSLDTWVHIVIERYNDVVTLYLDGKPAGNVAYSNNTNTTNPLLVGYMSLGPDTRRSLYGYVDEIRVTKGYARYKEEFTPPEHEFLQGGRYFYDEKGKTWNYGGDTIVVSDQKVYGEGSARLDGNGDYLQTTAVTDWYFGAKDFTIESFFRLPANPTGYGGWIVSRDIPAGVRDFRVYVQGPLTGVVGKVGMAFETIEGKFNLISIEALSLNEWYHLAVVRFGTQLIMFLDGVEQERANIGAASQLDGNRVVCVGTNSAPQVDVYLNGWVDELRVTHGVARYTQNFTPPEKAFPDTLIG